MECNCSTEGFNKEFGADKATNELKRYFKKGPKGNTKLLIDLIKLYDIKDKSLLDIGGGVGVIQFQLLDLGIKNVQSIDASQAYSNYTASLVPTIIPVFDFRWKH